MTTLVKNGKVWIDRAFRNVDIEIESSGKISSIRDHNRSVDSSFDKVVDAENHMVLPGGIDAHAHIEDGAETFFKGSCAAAAGGITTVVDMPPFHVCATLAGLQKRMRMAEETCVVDFCTHGGIVVEEEDLLEMDGVAKAGAAGFKVFMPAEPPVSRKVLWNAVKTAAKTGLRLVIHAEESACLETEVNWADPMGFANTRPQVAETAAAAFVLEMALAAGAPIHICHVSSGRTADLVDQYRGWGADVTAETTPHFLIFEKKDFNQLGARLKTTPPLREAYDNKVLWEALSDRVIDIVVSDHYLGALPNARHQEGFEQKEPGIAGLEVSLPLLYHEAVHKKRLTMSRFVEVTAERPAEIFGFDYTKGKLAPGMDADFVVFDPESETLVKDTGEFSRAADLPYLDWQLTGKIKHTFVRGREVYDGSLIQMDKGAGKFIPRKTSKK